MQKITKGEIKKFRCKQVMVAHWGSIFEVGKEYTVYGTLERKTKINRDVDEYWENNIMLPTIDDIKAESKEDKKKRQKANKENSKKYKFEMNIDYVEFVGDDKQIYDFSYQSLQDIIEMNDLDPTKRVDFDYTVYQFDEYFETIQFKRECKLEDLLD